MQAIFSVSVYEEFSRAHRFIKWGTNEPSSIFISGSAISCCHLQVVRLRFMSETRQQWTSFACYKAWHRSLTTTYIHMCVCVCVLANRAVSVRQDYVLPWHHYVCACRMTTSQRYAPPLAKLSPRERQPSRPIGSLGALKLTSFFREGGGYSRLLPLPPPPHPLISLGAL